MIQKLLTDIENEVADRINAEEKNLEAVKEMKLLLDQIDYEAEVVPFAVNVSTLTGCLGQGRVSLPTQEDTTSDEDQP